MTLHFASKPGGGGMCQDCGHDLLVRADGHVYCSNKGCGHHDSPHPTGKNSNTGRR